MSKLFQKCYEKSCFEAVVDFRKINKMLFCSIWIEEKNHVLTFFSSQIFKFRFDLLFWLRSRHHYSDNESIIF